MLLKALIAPSGLWIAYRLANLLINYWQARKLGIPIIILPIYFEDPWWAILRPRCAWIEQLPFGLGRWYRYSNIGWPMTDGRETISRLGETFILVSPGRNQIITAYPPAAERVYKDKNFFIPAPFSQAFAKFGQNVSSTNGAEWQRHRKITAQAFNGRNNGHVWEESVERTIEMLDSVSKATWDLAVLRSKFELLAMHVLVAVAFGQDTELTTVPKGHTMSLMDSLGYLLLHVFLTILFSGLRLPGFILPSSLRKLKAAVAEFGLYMQESVLEQMQRPMSRSTRSSGRGGLLEAIINANEAEKQEMQKSASQPSYLTESELYGNIFIFNLAGYETTAGTMTFALPFLALHPEVQDWLREEIDLQFTAQSGSPNYERTYPKLVRCLAFMHEVLRHAGPAPQMIRSPTEPIELAISLTSSITVTPGTLISGNFYGIHFAPAWGEDVTVFNPKRFVHRSPETGEETLASSPDGSMFMAWLFGARVCPGKKFSQVEFVAVIAQMLSIYHVELVQNDATETIENARERLIGVLDDKYFSVSTHLKRPLDAAIRLVRRD